ncbi:PREDICTED: uncharacterized protein LOC107343629 [Acropora digitifera]|uniref:uncharacterized protein LOC107343629 n=1 Tax=Acropora digitifera TaxID=70779 RepID=UPI00077AB9BC|nr:PREDICTED: uncharacterized protein LOC107343629 [Acropora digitifera]
MYEKAFYIFAVVVFLLTSQLLGSSEARSSNPNRKSGIRRYSSSRLKEIFFFKRQPDSINRTQLEKEAGLHSLFKKQGRPPYCLCGITAWLCCDKTTGKRPMRPFETASEN